MPIPNTTAFQQFLAGTGSMVTWWGDVGSNAKTNDSSVIGDVTGFSILPGSDDVYNSKTGQWEKLATARTMRRTAPISAGASMSWPGVDSDEKKKKAAWSRRGPSRRQGPVALDGDLSVRLPALPQLAFQHSGMGGGGLRRGLHQHPISTRSPTATTIRTPRSSRASPASSSTTPSPRTCWPRPLPAR